MQLAQRERGCLLWLLLLFITWVRDSCLSMIGNHCSSLLSVAIVCASTSKPSSKNSESVHFLLSLASGFMPVVADFSFSFSSCLLSELLFFFLLCYCCWCCRWNNRTNKRTHIFQSTKQWFWWDLATKAIQPWLPPPPHGRWLRSPKRSVVWGGGLMNNKPREQQTKPKPKPKRTGQYPEL